MSTPIQFTSLGNTNLAPTIGLTPGYTPSTGISISDEGSDSSIGRKTKYLNTGKQFLTNFLAGSLGKAGAAYHNRELIDKAIQGDPKAGTQALINVGGTMMGPAGYGLISADQALKRTTGKGVVDRWEDPRITNAYSGPGGGLAGQAGLF